jgi:hypothetical protein
MTVPKIHFVWIVICCMTVPKIHFVRVLLNVGIRYTYVFGRIWCEIHFCITC